MIIIHTLENIADCCECKQGKKMIKGIPPPVGIMKKKGLNVLIRYCGWVGGGLFEYS